MVEELTFGVWLRKQRRALDLTRQVFADQVGCAEVTLRRIEAGTLKPSKELASILLEKLGIPDAEWPQWISFARGLSNLPTLSSPSSSKPITNLPAPLTSFIGREKELEQIKKRLEKNRLVTLTGSGGVGKTRLSIQVASELLDEYLHGVWLVELAPVTNPSLVVQTVCTALDVTPQVNMPAFNVLMEYLRSKKVLLVVDNCEHLIDACAQLCDSLLQACSDLRMIASSREALGIDGEYVYRVPSLSLPHPNDGLHKVNESEAVKLFVERANAMQPNLELTQSNAPVIAQICQRLDGIALAIELAASRVKLLKVEQIASRLDDVFRLLTGGSRTALPRQRTLRAMIDWSYNLLSEEEKTVLRHLCVFFGGWTLEAAEFVCDKPNMLDLLMHLVDKSLVSVDLEHSDEPRYYLLETIRQYAREKLVECNEVEQARARYLEYFLRLAQRAEPEIYGARQIEWSQKLENEHENTRGALEWSMQGNVRLGQELAATLWWSWHFNGHLHEGYEWLEKILAVNPQEKTLVRAKLLSGAGTFASALGFAEEIGTKFSEASILLFRQLGDEQSTAFPLNTLANLAESRSDYDQAVALAEESRQLFKKAGNKWGVRFVLVTLGKVAVAQENFEQARKFYEESLSLAKEIGDQEGFAWGLLFMGLLAETLGDDERAMELYEEALQIEKVVKGKVATYWLLRHMGMTCIRQGDYEKGEVLLEEAIEISRKMGSQAKTAYILPALGIIACYQENYRKARSLYAESLQLLLPLAEPVDIADCIISIGRFLAAQGSFEKFTRLLGAAEGAVPDINQRMFLLFRIETEKFIMSARATLGDGAYTATYEAGKQMSLDEAVAYALKMVEEM